MTLPSSGTLSLSDLQTEFTGSNPISMSEYYKSGGNGYVPSTVAEAVTASSLGGSNSTNARYPGIGGYDPQINTFSRLYTQALWGDNGSTITMDRNFTVNKTGLTSITLVITYKAVEQPVLLCTRTVALSDHIA